MADANITYVDNTGGEATQGAFAEVMAAAYVSGELNEEYADIFDIKILENYNADGSNRMIIGWA